MNERATSSTAIPPSATRTPNSLNAASEEKSRVIVVEEEADNEIDDNPLRRRRRRRRRSLKTEGPERRIRAGLLAVVVVLLILAVTGAQAGSWLKSLLAQAKPMIHSSGIVAGIKNIFRWEVLALGIAALILLYLQPGVEDKVLRKLGIKKDRKRH